MVQKNKEEHFSFNLLFISLLIFKFYERFLSLQNLSHLITRLTISLKLREKSVGKYG